MIKIAIIGASGLFPGSSTKEAFWENLMNGADLATEEDFGMDPDLFFRPGKGEVDKCYSIRGGYIRDFRFDPEGYELPAGFLVKLDKLYQWSLFAAKEALRDSGYLRQLEKLRNCGVILGNLSFPTSSSRRLLLSSVYTATTERALKSLLGEDQFRIPSHKRQEPDNEILGRSPSRMVSDALGLGAGYCELDAACATSLYAIKLACNELVTGKADMMLAGAVSASDQLFIHMGFSIFQVYAPMDEKSVPLDRNSAGLVSSEGAGMVVLKRLEDAERDNDNILAIIGGIGLSNDGRGRSLLSPHPKGQRLAFERAYAAQGLSPKDTSYLECHATGIPLGDLTEINSIADFFAAHQNKPMLGSVKSNMGHLLTAAGMAGLLKVLLAMQKGVIPPTINLEEAMEAGNGLMSREQIITEATRWAGGRKQAGINSFGFGGTNAHMVVQNYTEAYTQTGPHQPVALQPMAITGMDAHFGGCEGLDDFYDTIYDGAQHFRKLPERRWKGFDENESLLKTYGFTDGKPPKGAYIEEFEIDLLRYKSRPEEVQTMEPQQALVLQVADRAIQDAGLAESQNVAVLIAREPDLAIHQYLAMLDLTWQLKEALTKSNILLDEEQEAELEALCKNSIFNREGAQMPDRHTSFSGNIMASRISALWDFSGPSFTVSCGENSVFKALEVAQQMLSLGEVEAVVVGGVDFSGGLENVLLRHKKDKVNAAANPSLSLNKGEQGWLVGEGAGAVVLKRADTIQDEKAYAIIDHIGQAKGLPEVDYLELAATGIAREEEMERQYLLENKPRGEVALGSVKTNIGNTFAASGIAGLIKTALCLHHRFIPGIPNWNEPEDAAAFEGSGYYFPEKSRPWIVPNGREKRRAAVNGLDGMQIRLAESVPHFKTKNTFLQKRAPHFFVLKGDSEGALRQQLSTLKTALELPATPAEISGRFYQKSKESSAAFGLVLLGSDKSSLQQEILFFEKQLSASFENRKALKTPRGSYFTPDPLGKKGKVAFVYPGSSTGYPGLGRDLFQLFPQLYDHFEKMLPNLEDYLWPCYLFPRKVRAEDPPKNIYDDAVAMMSVGVFFAAAYSHVLREYFRLDPAMAFGYSMGECSSMWYALGVWGGDEAREFQESPIFKTRFSGDLEVLAEHWGITSEEAKERWVSLVLPAPRERVEKLVDTEEHVHLTFVNTDREVVISGDKSACLAIAKQVNCPTVTIPFQNIIHHEFCDKEREGLLKMHHFPLQQKPPIDFYSSITRSKLELDSRKIAENSAAVCCRQVDFPATVRTIFGAGANIFIELGSHSTCTGWIADILKGEPHLAVSMDKKGKQDRRALMEMLAQLVSHGVDLDLSVLYPPSDKEMPKRTFLKKIIPGGARIFDTLMSEENRTKFAAVKRRPLEAPTGVLATVESSGSSVDLPAFPETPKGRASFSNYLQSEESVSTMEKSTVADTLEPKARLGENGLRLQDYESGEHLEGKEIIFTREDLEEFAAGKIANVFGPEYTVIDNYRRRVMLPMHPYLLVSRVTGLEATRGEFKPSTMQTEYDIPYNAWFTTDRQIPWAVSVESGQCDMLLISYLGIDFQNKGELVYRLLDCTLTFVDDLPFEGQTLRYDISINSFVRNGDNLLFFFSYRCYVQDRLVLKMDDGCAGFFTDEQLEKGQGVVYTGSELEVRRNARKKHFTPLLNTKKRSFSKEDLRHLINGDIEKCFEDESYYANGRNPSLHLPPEKILMIDRITSVDLTGGAYGLGYIVAEKDLHPGDWYFPCHFRDDEVLAGSLQAEGGGNLLRFFMLMLGMQRLTKDARYQPVFDRPQKVRCRKQVTPKDTRLVYKLEIKEIGLVPDPYVIGDMEIISDGVVAVHFENLGLQLREKSNPRYLDQTDGVEVSPRSEGALFNEEDLTTFALGDMSKCFGEEFAIYEGRTHSRQPNTDLQLVSRVWKIEGERRDFSKPATIWTEYDVPADAWYYEQNSSATMPYSILMEISLQPCGLLGAYLGSTLQFPDKNLYFRNLDGEGELLDPAEGTDFRGKTIANKVVLVSSVALGGTILQNYTFELSVDGHVFYKGKSSFGFFPEEALATQVGLDNGKEIAPWYQAEQLQPKDYMQIRLDSLYGKMKLFKAPADKPHYRLAEKQLNLLDKLIIDKDGGRHGKGYIHATRFMKPYDWFFTCHFYQDPVMPGSMGVEAILQAMQVFALQQDLGKDFRSPRFVQLPNHTTIWKYRGQILRDVKEMHLEVHIKTIEPRGDQLAILADAYLWNGKMRIYQVTDLGLRVEEG
jgi:PfaB family protein